MKQIEEISHSKFDLWRAKSWAREASIYRVMPKIEDYACVKERVTLEKAMFHDTTSWIATLNVYQLTMRYTPLPSGYCTAVCSAWLAPLRYHLYDIKYRVLRYLRHLLSSLLPPKSLGLTDAVYLRHIGSKQLQLVELRVELKKARCIAATESKDVKKMEVLALKTAIEAKFNADHTFVNATSFSICCRQCLRTITTMCNCN